MSLYKGSFLDWYAKGEPVIKEGITLQEVARGIKEDTLTAILVNESQELGKFQGILHIPREHDLQSRNLLIVYLLRTVHFSERSGLRLAIGPHPFLRPLRIRQALRGRPQQQRGEGRRGGGRRGCERGRGRRGDPRQARLRRGSVRRVIFKD